MKAFRDGINVDLFQAVLHMIAAFPKRFNMDSWQYEDEKCGTVCCFAGWVKQLSDPRDSTFTKDFAQEKLGLYWHETNRLFNVYYWPKRYRNAIDKTKQGTRDYAAVAIRRYKHFLKTGD